MAEASKLELILLAKDKMSPAIQRLLSLLKQTEKEGKTSTNAVDKLTRKLERAPKTDGITKAKTEIKKATDEAVKAEEKLNKARQKKPSGDKTKQETNDAKKLGEATEKAAKSEEKLNNARRKKSSDGGKTKQETADTKKLGDAAEKAAKSEEKLNNAIKKRPRKSNPGTPPNRNPASLDSPKPNRGSRNSFEDDLIQGGTGAGLVWASKTGFESAMTKQESLNDLRNSFYRSSLGVADLNSQMMEAEKQADVLGNKLPGTTSDMLKLYQTLKESGVDTKTILSGAGESAAYLAVANKEDFADVGQNLGFFGQIYGLKGEEYKQAANLMSKIKTSKGLGSEELIEASKYFGGRMAVPLGLQGIKGADDSMRFLSFVRQNTGMQGSLVGTSSTEFFSQFVKSKGKKDDPLKEIKKLTGVDLELFGKKGNFLGLDNAVAQFAKLKGKLTDEQQIDFGQKIAGQEGGSIMQTIVGHGDEFKSFNNDITNTINLTDKSAKNAEILTNKFEALGGSLSNLGAASFGPMLEPLSKATDGANDLVGKLTELAKSYPTTAATTAGVLTLGGAFLGLKASSGILSRLTKAAAEVGDAAEGSTKKVGGLGKGLGSIPTAVKVALTIEMLGIAWEQFQQLRDTLDKWKETNKGLDDAGKMSYKAQQYEDESLKEQGKAPNYKNRADEALSLLQAGSKQFEKAIDPKRMNWTDSFYKMLGAVGSGEINDGFYSQGGSEERWKKLSPEEQATKKTQYSNLTQKYNKEPVPSIFTSGLDRATKELLGAEAFQRRAPMLADPNTMTAFRRDTLPTLNLSPELKQHVENMLKDAFPDSFKQSTIQMAMDQARLSEQTNQLNQSFFNLQQPMPSLIDQFGNLNTNSNTASGSILRLGDNAASVAARLGSLEIKAPSIVASAPVADSSTPPGREKGGSITKGGIYRWQESGREFFTSNQSGSVVSNDMVRKADNKTRYARQIINGEALRNFNSNKKTSPLDSSSAIRNRRGASATAQNITLSPTMNFDLRGTNYSEQQIQKIVDKSLASFMSEIKEDLRPDRLAQKVEWAAHRDSERT